MSAALTRREHRVKEILLQELERINRHSTSQVMGLSYAEKQHLVKRIDYAFIDREVEKMGRMLRRRKWYYGAFAAVALLLILSFLLKDARLADIGGYLLMEPLLLFGFYKDYRSLQRKMFIYEALRELSDVDEADLLLGDTVERADDLIDTIVQREIELEEQYPLYPLRARNARMN